MKYKNIKLIINKLNDTMYKFSSRKTLILMSFYEEDASDL